MRTLVPVQAGDHKTLEILLEELMQSQLTWLNISRNMVPSLSAKQSPDAAQVVSQQLGLIPAWRYEEMANALAIRNVNGNTINNALNAVGTVQHKSIDFFFSAHQDVIRIAVRSRLRDTESKFSQMTLRRLGELLRRGR